MARKTSFKRIFWRSVVIVALLAIAAVALGFFLLRSEPAHWQRHQQRRAATPQTQRVEQAQQLEARFTALLSYTNPAGDPGITFVSPTAQDAGVSQDGLGVRRIQLTSDEVNAWLETRLPEWLENQGVTLPVEVKEPMFAAQNGLVILAFRYESDNVSQIVSMSFRPELVGQDQNNRQLVFALAGVQGGKLPLPSGSLVSRLETQAAEAKNEALKRVSDALAGRPFDPVMPMADGKRTVRLIDFDLGEEESSLTVRLDPAR